MEEDGFVLTPEELELAQRANQALLDYVPTLEPEYVDRDGFKRRPTTAERFAARIFAKHFDSVQRFPNDDGSLIIERLFPYELGGHHIMTRGMSQKLGTPAVLNFMRFNSWTIGNSEQHINSYVISEPTGKLTYVELGMKEKVEKPCGPIIRSKLLGNLALLATK